MSTEFTSTTTEQVGFVRFAGSVEGTDGERVRCTMFEFGTVSQFERVCSAMRQGDRFEPFGGGPCNGDPETVEDLERLVVEGRVTFGRFPVTVEVGSGQMFDFTVEQ